MYLFTLDDDLRLENDPFDRRRLRDPRSTTLALAQNGVGPELLHHLGEVLDDVGAIELLVVDETLAFFAVELQVLGLARRATELDHYA